MRVLIVLCCLLTSLLRAQEFLPFVENFGKTDFKGDNQVWSVTQGADMAMYFANNQFFLRYDGVKWEQYTLPDNTIIRSVLADGDRIYCGSYREFGYWTRHNGRMVYQSLSAGQNLFTGDSNNEEIWKIIRHGDKIYFQSFNDLFVYQNGKTYKVRFPAQVSYCYLVGQTLYAATVTDGIYILKGRQFVRQNWDVLNGNVIHHIDAINGRLFVFTKNNGIFVLQDGRMQRWNHPANQVITPQIILSARYVAPNNLAVGTALNGLYLINLDTGNWRNIDRQNGLKNNAVLSIGLDSERDLWLGLDNGISHVEINSPVEIVIDNSGDLGSVYAISAIENGYLFATNHGLFRYSNKKLTPVPGTGGQAWNLYRHGARYVLGHNDGTFVYDRENALRANSITGGWTLIKSKFDQVYYQSHYAGVVIYPNLDNLMEFVRIEGLSKPIRYILQVRRGELWAADNYRGLYKIELDENHRTVSLVNVTEKNGIARDFGVKLFDHNGEVLALADGHWYTFDRKAQKLVPHPEFDKQFGGVSSINRISEKELLIVKKGVLYRVIKEGHRYVWNQIPQKYYSGKLISGHLNPFSSGGKLFVNLDDGSLVHSLSKAQKDIKVKLEVYRGSRLIASQMKIPYGISVSLHAISNYFGYNRPDLYYSLNGATPVRLSGGKAILANLASGDQEIRVFVRGDGFDQVAQFSFAVGYPWYFSAWMILLYVTIAGAILFVYYRWNKFRYTQRLRLEQEEMRHAKDLMELRLKAENDLKIREYEKHILELELQNKSTEVAGKSFSIAKQGEIIETIDQILDTQADVNHLKLAIRKAIRANSLNKHEWESFESNMKQLHHDFVRSLANQYPQLSPKDIRLAIFLRMNLSSKEIAPLMNISFRGVELHRYRLRKKMGLPGDVNLAKYMMTFE